MLAFKSIKNYARIIGINTRTYGNNRHILQCDMFGIGVQVIGNYDL